MQVLAQRFKLACCVDRVGVQAPVALYGVARKRHDTSTRSCFGLSVRCKLDLHVDCIEDNYATEISSGSPPVSHECRLLQYSLLHGAGLKRGMGNEERKWPGLARN